MIRKIIKAFLYICLIFIILFAFFLYLYGIRPLIVLSGSMEPVIHTGSLIFIDKNQKDALPGDIITVDLHAGRAAGDGELLVTHRVVRWEDGFIVTKGDANKSEDLTLISPDMVLGTYVYGIPHAGFLIARLRQLLPREKK